MNTLHKLNFPKLFLVLVLLGAYSASMYKFASTQVLHTRAVDMSISESTPEDADKIRAVIKPRVVGHGSTTYLPGVACVIEAGPGTTIDMMEEYFSTCIDEHHTFTGTPE